MIMLLLFLIVLKLFKDQLSIYSNNERIINLILHETNSYIPFNGFKFDNITLYTLKKYEYASDINFNNTTDPIIYIYNTHDKEKYLDYNGVYEAAKLFETEFEKLGINVIVEEEKVSPYLSNYSNTFIGAYAISRSYFEKVIDTYPNLKLVIDLHRDALEREYSYVTINGVNYAKILFVQGVRYENYQKNLELVTKISDKVKEKYPGMSKGVMLKNKENQHDSYNQDLSINAMLLELGSNNNYYEEVSNTVKAIVPIIMEVMNEKND